MLTEANLIELRNERHADYAAEARTQYMEIELAINADRLGRIIELMDSRHGCGKTEYTALRIAKKEKCVVQAAPQACMFIIGELAASGEGCLVSAKLVDA